VLARIGEGVDIEDPEPGSTGSSATSSSSSSSSFSSSGPPASPAERAAALDRCTAALTHAIDVSLRSADAPTAARAVEAAALFVGLAQVLGVASAQAPLPQLLGAAAQLLTRFPDSTVKHGEVVDLARRIITVVPAHAMAVLGELPGVTHERLTAFQQAFSPPAQHRQQRAALLRLFEEHLPVIGAGRPSTQSIREGSGTGWTSRRDVDRAVRAANEDPDDEDDYLSLILPQ
jgi:hypothetical protein